MVVAPENVVTFPMIPFKGPLRLVLIGPPASGKGTIAKLIQSQFGPIETLSTGALLQKIAQQTDEEGQRMKTFLASGDLMADEQITKVLFRFLGKIEGDKSWLLDGYPRTFRQAQLLDEQLKESQLELDLAIMLDIPEKVIHNRIFDRLVHLSSGRTYSMSYNPPRVPGIDDITGEALTKRYDDQTGNFQKRYGNYQKHYKDIEKYYKDSGKLFIAHGNDSNTLFSSISATLNHLYSFPSFALDEQQQDKYNVIGR